MIQIMRLVTLAFIGELQDKKIKELKDKIKEKEEKQKNKKTRSQNKRTRIQK